MGSLPTKPLADIAAGNEFVLLVHAHQHGSESVDSVVQTLRERERLFDIKLVAPSLPFENREDTGEIIVRGDARYEHLEYPPDDLLEKILHEQLFPFLTDTWAILYPAFPDEFDIVFQNRYFYHATARGYAHTHAQWAQQTRWLGKRQWSYLNFYCLQGFNEEFISWLETLYSVVKEMNEWD